MSQVPRGADAVPLPEPSLTTAEFAEAVAPPAPVPVVDSTPEERSNGNMRLLGLIAIGFGILSATIGISYTLSPSKLVIGENQIGVHWTAPTAPPNVWTEPGSYSYRGGKTYVYTNTPRAFYARVDTVSKDETPYKVEVKYKWTVKQPEHFFALHDSWEGAEAAMRLRVQANANSAFKSYDKGAVARNKEKIGKVIEKGLASEFWTYDGFEIELTQGKPVKLNSVSPTTLKLTAYQSQLGSKSKYKARKPVRYVQRRPRECGFFEIGCF